jgi:putative ABC transport system permease protein
MLLTLAWRNLWRNKSRSLITMASVFCAVVLAIVMAALQRGVFDNLIKNVVGFYSGYLQIHQKGYWDEQTLENAFQFNDSLQMQLDSEENILAASPRLESFVLASSGEKTKGCLVAGVLPSKEANIIHLKDKLVSGQYLTDDDQGVIIGEGLAKRLSLGLNDTIVLLGQGYYGSVAAGKFAIRGLLHFGAPELNDNMLFLALPQAQLLFDAEGFVTSVVISPKRTEGLEILANKLRQQAGPNYEVMTWEEMMPEIVQHIETDVAGTYIILGVLYLVISFGIFSTLLMMVAERQREFGMLVAVGLKKRKLAWMLTIESLLVTLTGCGIGILVAVPITYYLNRNPIRFSGNMGEVFERFGFEAVFPASTDPKIVIYQGLIVLVVGLLLATYPVLKALKLNPVKAMRK